MLSSPFWWLLRDLSTLLQGDYTFGNVHLSVRPSVHPLFVYAHLLSCFCQFLQDGIEAGDDFVDERVILHKVHLDAANLEKLLTIVRVFCIKINLGL